MAAAASSAWHQRAETSIKETCCEEIAWRQQSVNMKNGSAGAEIKHMAKSGGDGGEESEESEAAAKINAGVNMAAALWRRNSGSGITGGSMAKRVKSIETWRQ